MSSVKLRFVREVTISAAGRKVLTDNAESRSSPSFASEESAVKERPRLGRKSGG